MSHGMYIALVEFTGIIVFGCYPLCLAIVYCLEKFCDIDWFRSHTTSRVSLARTPRFETLLVRVCVCV